jgi:membrane fusion protein, copper/silver efflux system
MTTPNPNTGSRTEASVSPMLRTRRLLLAIIPVSILAAAAVLWTAGAGRANPQDAAVDHSAHAAPVAVDPHAGHDMNGGVTTEGVVRLEPEMARTLGITVMAAELGEVRRSIRTTGNVVYDETRLTTVTPKFSGFAERLHVSFTGQAVTRGQPLLEIYSPELVAAQEELLAAVRMERQLQASAAPAVAERATALVEASRRRLLLWDVAPAQLQQIERTGQVRRTLTLHAPFSGFVTERLVQAGQAIEAGMPLYRLADLSSVWIEADVYEQDLRFIRAGEPVGVEIAAYPGERFAGRVSYVYPEVSLDTRTARVRAELSNRDGRVKPGMFATVDIEAPLTERAVLVPRDAVMHSGTHAMVFVEEVPGVYRTREVRVGADAGPRTQILSGLIAGERVVTRANFLLDSESRLRDGDDLHMGH